MPYTSQLVGDELSNNSSSNINDNKLKNKYRLENKSSNDNDDKYEQR